jgi:hypothetical protein
MNILILAVMGAALAGLVVVVMTDGKARYERSQEQARAAMLRASARPNIDGCTELSCPYHGPELRRMHEERRAS